MNTKELQATILSNSLKALPGGELIVWLEKQLKTEDFQSACSYILETILNGLVTICDTETQTKLGDFLVKDNFDGFFQVLADLLDSKVNPKAAVFQYQLMDSVQLGFEVVCTQHGLDLET